jgi:hypothetical protein
MICESTRKHSYLGCLPTNTLHRSTGVRSRHIQEKLQQIEKRFASFKVPLKSLDLDSSKIKKLHNLIDGIETELSSFTIVETASGSPSLESKDEEAIHSPNEPMKKRRKKKEKCPDASKKVCRFSWITMYDSH